LRVTASYPVVAVDGPAGSGKSTLSERLARALGLPYVNTGLMYRALTLEALRQGVAAGDGEGLAALARKITFNLSSGPVPMSLLIDGKAPSEELTSPEVEREVSMVSSHPEVRAIMRNEQRRLGRKGAVMEGRDIGSVVFPDAQVKLFLVAEPGERAARRTRERDEAGGPADPTMVAQALQSRDARDAVVNPPIPGAGAMAVDTTDRTADAVFAEVLALVRDRLAGIR
jgi:cytidylate kinase